MEDNKQQFEQDNSLENNEVVLETIENPDRLDSVEITKKKTTIIEKFKDLISRLNVYLLMFIVIVFIGIVVFFVIFNASQSPKDFGINTQELTQEAVDDLIGSDAKVGDPKQLLTVESDSIFSGKVLIREGLDVAGPIKVGGSLSLPGITVSGNSAFDEVSMNAVTIARDATIQGQLSVREGLTVNGPVTFSGTLSATTFAIELLQVNQDLQINRHIDAGGPTPGITGGGATGNGGTVTISGTDTAGTVTVNIGTGAGAGVLATVNFNSSFAGTPHVVITPVATIGSPLISGTQKFYLSSRTATNFSIATSGALPNGSISFDYIVIN